MRLEELGTTERQLWHSYARGHRVAPRPATPRGPRPSVRAEFLAALLLGAGPEPGPGERPALRLDGVSVTGTLDLEFAEVIAPVALTDCHFDEAPLLRGAQFRELVLSDCVLPGLSADTVEVRGRMVLSHCRLSGPLVLTRAEIHSDLDLRRTVITAPGRDAVRAVRLSTGGDLLCTGLTVHGLTRVTGAVVAGEFDLEGAHLSNPGGTALDAYHVHVTEDFTFHPGFRSEGRLILSGAQVAAALGFCGARLSNPGDIALEAVDVTVHRNADLGLGLTVEGGVQLDGTRVGTLLSFRDATVDHPSGTALSLRLVQARETDLRTRRPIDGTVDAGNAQLGVLHDAPDTWPTGLRLAHTAYDALATPSPPANGSPGSGAGRKGTSRSPTSSSPPPTGAWGTRTRPVPSCSPSSGTAAPRSPLTRACGATSRTPPSATATGPPAPHCGSSPFSPWGPPSSPRIPPLRWRRARPRRSARCSTPSTSFSPSSASGRRPPSRPTAAGSCSPTR